MTTWHLYIIECADGTLYTGITTDIERRLNEHNGSDLAAKYTRGRGPVQLKYSRKFKTKSEASKEEYRIKKLSREEKLKLCAKLKKNNLSLHV